jgi:hypothetical protein
MRSVGASELTRKLKCGSIRFNREDERRDVFDRHLNASANESIA